MHLAQDNDVVHTFTPDRSDQPFRAIKLQLPVFRAVRHHAENETIAAISEPAIAEAANCRGEDKAAAVGGFFYHVGCCAGFWTPA